MIAVNAIFQQYISGWMKDRLTQELEWQTRIAAESFHSLGHHYALVDADQLADRLGMLGATRFTFINELGSVVGDSELALSQINSGINISEELEIKQALELGRGMTERYSMKNGTNMMYMAIRHTHHDANYIVRTATPLHLMEKTILEIQMAFVLAAIITVALIGIFIWSMSYRIGRKINLEHDHLEKQVAIRTSELKLLQEFGSMLATCVNMEEVESVTQRITEKLIGDIPGAISIMKSSRNMVEVVASWGGWQGKSVYSPSECWALRKGYLFISNRDNNIQSCNHLEQHEKPVLCIQMVAQGETLGTYHLEFAHQDDVGKDERRIAASIAEKVSLTLANLKLREDLQHQAIRDPLTGLFNRRYLEESMDRELKRAERNNSIVGIMMLDLDHFKRFNDSFGHDAGDMVLRKLGESIKESIRSVDIACRFGGEEFIIIMPECEVSDLESRANMLCDKVRLLDLQYQNSSLGRITLSIGLSSYPRDGFTKSLLITHADKALYKAKKDGRDRVVYVPSENSLLKAKAQNNTDTDESVH